MSDRGRESLKVVTTVQKLIKTNFKTTFVFFLLTWPARRTVKKQNTTKLIKCKCTPDKRVVRIIVFVGVLCYNFRNVITFWPQ